MEELKQQQAQFVHKPKRPNSKTNFPFVCAQDTDMVRTKQTARKGAPAATCNNRAASAALREISTYRKSTDRLLHNLPFYRLVLQIAQDMKEDICFQSTAVLALQEATEAYVFGLCENTNSCAIHSERITIIRIFTPNKSGS